MNTVRHRLKTRRVGHAGTLDPFATGLLVVLVGGATRLMQYVVGLGKRYEGVIRLGTTTDTYDGTGAVVAETDTWRNLSDEQIGEQMGGFLGRSMQRPPRYSAKKIDGEPAHRRMRRGEEVEVADREVEVSAFGLQRRDGPEVTFEATVGSGTYIRSLAADLGERLGCGAHLHALRRVSVGDFDVADAIAPDSVTPDAVRPAAAAVAHLASVQVDAAARTLLGHGRGIAVTAEEGRCVALAGSELIAVGDVVDGVFHPRTVVDAG